MTYRLVVKLYQLLVSLKVKRRERLLLYKCTLVKLMQMHGHFKTETNIRHVRVILRCDSYRNGKFGKFFKSKFKILTCVVLLGRLNTVRGISAGGYEQYDEGNMSRGNIYCYQIYSYYLSLAFPCYNQNHHARTFQTFDICF